MDSSDNIYLTGFADTPVLGQDALTDGGSGAGPFLAKFDPNASPIWARKPHRLDITLSRFEGVSVAPSGECYISGYFSWPGIVFDSDTLSATTPGFNMLAAHYSTDGQFAGARNAGGSAGHIVGYDVSAGPANRSYVTGGYGFDGIFGSDTIGLGPGFFVTKFSPGGPVGIQSPSPVASTVFLGQNYPNPFNPATTIHYELPTAADVSIIIYNIPGQKVRPLVNRRQSAGFYEAIWNGDTDFGAPAASGVYFYRLTADNAYVSQAKKMLLIR